MRKLSTSELGRKSVSEFHLSKKTPVIIVLDNVRSGLNVGSIFRTADAFLFEAIYVCGITAQPPHKEILKTALGAHETVAWKYFSRTMDAIEELKKNQYQVAAVEQTDKSILLSDFNPGKKTAIVFGHEVSGVNQEIIDACDVSIEIPQSGMKHSLNIAVCAGIVCYDLFMKLK